MRHCKHNALVPEHGFSGFALERVKNVHGGDYFAIVVIYEANDAVMTIRSVFTCVYQCVRKHTLQYGLDLSSDFGVRGLSLAFTTGASKKLMK